MKAFLLRTCFFLLLQGVLFLFCWSPRLPHEHNYLAATLDKHAHLRASPSPRLILVGGSNLAFGINSAILRDELGLEVVNMGLNASLGIPYMLDEIEPDIRAGDLVVLSFEYDILAREPVDLLLRQLLEIRPANFRALPVNRWKSVLDRYGFSIIGAFVGRNIALRTPSDIRDDGYRREYFDADGCYVGHYGKDPTFQAKNEPEIPRIAAAVEERVSRFVKSCRARGVFCAISCPPHPASMVRAKIEAIEENFARLRTINGLIILDEPLDHAYPEDHFYDTSYHLTQAGTMERTLKLARSLRRVLDGPIGARQGIYSLHTLVHPRKPALE
jgi:hypothetical protein